MANRFYYQTRIPHQGRGDPLQLPATARSGAQLGPAHPRPRRRRATDPGGIEAWLRLGEAVGLTRERARVPAARAAARRALRGRRLRELRAPRAVERGGRVVAHRALRPRRDRARGSRRSSEHYPWIDPAGLDVLPRPPAAGAARRRATALDLVARRYCTTRADQERAVEVLRFKLDVLWAQLDAIIERARPPSRRREPGPASPTGRARARRPAALGRRARAAPRAALPRGHGQAQRHGGGDRSGSATASARSTTSWPTSADALRQRRRPRRRARLLIGAMAARGLVRRCRSSGPP